ncbi:MAG TPA: bifunctional diaminohydroxyphosphoribosylaminopyrimidine deaminase/5-amino-6-(5-phosphoribosylamino)uracil reductase RibD [Thermoanaerobaculia bacterium]|nr:bifunctional diaminohydroxyphosphoribosylaminopyrimidine deaminase/5-amino-6-(5-phosphoribosylamino)uracil reductase RibD [Thermoanaerobaculia bacterium]
MTAEREDLLSRALDLAERGRYTVSPNPMVGAVVARGRRVVGEAWHRRAGGPHAEVAALRRAGALARGADLYLTLEPCVHFGRTPPCAPRIVESGVARVFVASRDPNPLVSGRGIRALRRAGIRVDEAAGELRRRAEAQNEKFRLWIRQRRPFVLAKWAASLDGKTASASGESRWITGPEARRRALLLREEYDAVLVGSGTVLADDPLLTRRLGTARSRPHRRIVLDGRLRVPPTARVFRGIGGALVVTTLPERHARARRLAARGVEVWSVPGAGGGVSLPRLLERLAGAGVSSLMVEGGADTLGRFFRAGLVDRVAVFLAPKLLGGESAPGGIGGPGFPLSRARRVRDVEHEQVGEDWLVTGRVRSSK